MAKFHWPLAVVSLHLLLGMSLLCLGLIAGFEHLVSFERHAVEAILHPSGSIMALLVGLVLLLNLGRHTRSMQVTAGTLLLLCLLALATRLTPWAPSLLEPLDALRTALLMVLSLFALTALMWRPARPRSRLWCWGSGSLISLVSLLSLISVWWPSLGAAQISVYMDTSLLFSPLSLLLGLCVVTLDSLHKHQVQAPSALKSLYLIATAGALISGGTVHLLKTQQGSNLLAQGQAWLDQVESLLIYDTDYQLALINRIAERWVAHADLPSEHYWHTDVQAQLRDQPAFELLAMLDHDFELQTAQSRTPTGSVWLDNFLSQSTSRHWLEHVQATGRPHLSPSHHCPRGGRFSTLAAPVAQHNWLLAAVDMNLRLKELLERLNAPFYLTIQEGDITLYTSLHRPEDTVFLAQRDLVLHHDLTWELATHASPHQLAPHRRYLPAGAFFASLGLTFLLVVSRQLGHIAISERTQLARSNQQLNQLLDELDLMKRGIDATANGVIIADARQTDLPIIYVNPAFENITQYTAAEVLGRNCRFLRGTEHKQPGLETLRRALQTSAEARVVLRNFRKDGTPFWNDLHITPIRDQQGQVSHFIGILNDISEKKAAESQLAFNASHDALTGLPNRTLLADRLSQACQFVQRHQRQLAALFIDLDGFKPINDSLGHAVGDQVLVEISRRLVNNVRREDTVARLGSDEFVVLLPDLHQPDDALQLTETLLKVISQPLTFAGHTLHVTASIGLAITDGRLEQPMVLIQQADLAMSRAKNKGRNTWDWYSEELNNDAQRRVLLRNELREALDRQQMRLYFQPLVDAKTGKIKVSEALVRWEHPTLGLVSPMDFIPLAETTGQIIPLGTWVLEEACRVNRSLHDQGFHEHCIAVNVSPLQLNQADFASVVSSALQKAGLAAEYLELEIVESVLLHNTDQVIATLHALRNLGVGISIDDFGTGFSSLSYMKLLPATKLKIDRAFVQDVIRDRRDASIVRGVISMTHHLGLTVVAEGIETEAQANFLRKSGCDLLQGYLYARPMPLAELEQRLRQNQLPTRLASDQTDQETASQQTLLLLDDEENILKALSRVLRKDGYRILATTSATEAFQLLAKEHVQVIISDQRMPEISGTEFLSQVKSIYPRTTRMVLSGYTDLKSVTDAINEGAIYKFLTKPWDDRQIRDVVRQAFMEHESQQT